MREDDAAAPPCLAVVDDCAEFRRVVRAVAEPLGWAVSEFETGRKFAVSLAEMRPDRVLLDIVMPDMDGIETIHRMADPVLRCPIILISGRQPLYSHSALKLGQAYGLDIADVLQKPVGLERLRATLDFDAASSGC